MQMVVQTGTVLSGFRRQPAAAGAEMIQLADQFNGFFHRGRAGVGSEIFGFILFHGSGKKNPGILLLERHPDERICFIVLQHGVILGTVLFDQITLQDQGFQFRVCDNVLKSGDLRHHALNLQPFIPAALKILAHPVFQADRLSHINNLIPGVMHQVNSRFSREFFQFFFNIKCHVQPSSEAGEVSF